MRLQQLIQDLAENQCGHETCEITGLSLNSQEILSGELFIALKGYQRDGRAFIHDAIAKGAGAVICEAEGLADYQFNSQSIPIIPIKNLASKLGLLAKRFYGDPSGELQVIGVTGTNGKTTSCVLLAQCLSQLNMPCAAIGTLGYGFIEDLSQPALTTPDAVTVQKQLNILKNKGAQCVAMEVSSHGLAQGRVSNVVFNSAIFTNLTQDHLDYHGNMDAYGKAKLKLFQFPSLKWAIVNADSPFAEKVLRTISSHLPTVLYSLHPLSPDQLAMKKDVLTIFVKEYELDKKGITAVLQTPWGEGILRSPLLGEFNISNLLGVLAELCMRGIKLDTALSVLSQALAPPGRMQRLGGVTTPQVIVDYAHTPDALKNALMAARLHCRRRLWCVFGCGGDRDKEKRAKMGQVADLYADRVILTNDNPRTESPQKIISDILQGFSEPHSDKVIVEEDRRAAIEYAINHALAVDTILVAGKGHENSQIIGEKKIPFSDIECVNTLFREDPNNDEIIHYS